MSFNDYYFEVFQFINGAISDVLLYSSEDYQELTQIHCTSGLYPADYRILLKSRNSQSTNCEATYSHVVSQGTCDLSSIPAIMVNEFSNGFNKDRDYIELILIGDGSCASVDISEFIIDDNGTFDENPINRDPGFLKFKDIEIWKNMQPGAMIVIYNSAKRSPEIPEDDPEDANKDNIYILPSDHVNLESLVCDPTVSTNVGEVYRPRNNCPELILSDGNWDYIRQNDDEDVIQILYPDGSFCHGICRGIASCASSGLPIPTVLVGVGGVISFTTGNLASSSNYVLGTAHVDGTPGVTNNDANELFRSTVICTDEDIINSTSRVIINEYSNGGNGYQEYVELLVTGDRTPCSTVDLRGYIIDDNNGDFSSSAVGGFGISSGHIKFSNDENWASIPKGSLILIYNELDRNDAITDSDDPTDENDDLIYILPANHNLLEGQAQFPSVANPYDYETSRSVEDAMWEYITTYDIKDAIQIRNREGEYVHGISYGVGMTGGPQNLKVHDFQGTNKCFSFKSGAHNDYNNFLTEDISSSSDPETPGYSNNADNDDYIISLRCIALTSDTTEDETIVVNDRVNDLTSDVLIYPNPFDNYLQIEFIYEDDASSGNLILMNFLGVSVLKESFRVTGGRNVFRVNMPKTFPMGMYTVEIVIDQVVVANKILLHNP